jgi:hypothetical protein
LHFLSTPLRNKGSCFIEATRNVVESFYQIFLFLFFFLSLTQLSLGQAGAPVKKPTTTTTTPKPRFGSQSSSLLATLSSPSPSSKPPNPSSSVVSSATAVPSANTVRNFGQKGTFYFFKLCLSIAEFSRILFGRLFRFIYILLFICFISFSGFLFSQKGKEGVRESLKEKVAEKEKAAMGEVGFTNAASAPLSSQDLLQKLRQGMKNEYFLKRDPRRGKGEGEGEVGFANAPAPLSSQDLLQKQRY